MTDIDRYKIMNIIISGWLIIRLLWFGTAWYNIDIVADYLFLFMNFVLRIHTIQNSDVHPGKSDSVLHLSLCSIFCITSLCSTGIDISNTFVKSVIIVGVYAVLEYRVIPKFPVINYRCLIIFVIAAICIVSYLQLMIVYRIGIQQTTYTFKNNETYEKCKMYWDGLINECYVVLDYSNDSLYVRHLGNSETEFIKFDSSEERDQYVEKNTLGLNTPTDIPYISPNNSTFDDSTLTVSCRGDYTIADASRDMLKFSGYCYLIIELFVGLYFFVLWIYGKKRTCSFTIARNPDSEYSSQGGQ